MRSTCHQTHSRRRNRPGSGTVSGAAAAGAAVLLFALACANEPARAAETSPDAKSPADVPTAIAAPDDGGAPNEPARETESPDEPMTLRGGQDRTDFRSLTVEGEDRVHYEIERPPLTVDLDPASVKGLETGSAADVLDRTTPDLTSAYMRLSARTLSPYLARPYVHHYATGAVARFRPAVKGVARWKLAIADSRGQIVATREGRGSPPKEITWDGTTGSGSFVVPGLTYSYVFEAHDKAGNKRNFVGEGFKIGAYRLEGKSGPTLIFSGASLRADGSPATPWSTGAVAVTNETPACVLEAASWLNQLEQFSSPVRVVAIARTADQANRLSRGVASRLGPLLLGDPARVQPSAEVASDAPDEGTLRIGLVGGAATSAPTKKPSDPTSESTGKAKQRAKR